MSFKYSVILENDCFLSIRDINQISIKCYEINVFQNVNWKQMSFCIMSFIYTEMHFILLYIVIRVQIKITSQPNKRNVN